MLEDKFNEDLKQAMLAGDKFKVTTLRTLKAAILNAKVANNSRDKVLDDDKFMAILSHEAKKRQESANLFLQGGNKAKSEDELKEKNIIDSYLPDEISEEELSNIIDLAIKELNASDPKSMGQVISKVRQQVGIRADGGAIAKLVKEKLS